MDWIDLAKHEEVEFHLQAALRHGHSVLVCGPRGVGKTASVQRYIENKLDRDVQKQMDDPQYQRREIIYYESSRAEGTQTALVDLMEEVGGMELSYTAKRKSGRALILDIARELRQGRIGLVCIDEAQQINAHNLDLLRQVPDMADQELDHTVGLVFIGNSGLRRSLIEIQQLGQRVSAEVEFGLLEQKHMAPLLPRLHPHLATLKETLDEDGWKPLEDEICVKVGGSLRRLERLLQLANHLVLDYGRPMDARMLNRAIDELADQV